MQILLSEYFKVFIWKIFIMKNSSTYCQLFTLIITLIWTTTAISQPTVELNRADGIYDINESILFTVSSTSDSVQYDISHDRFTPTIISNKVPVENGKATFEFSLNSPNTVLCKVTTDEGEAAVGALIDPFKIDALMEEPSDFDQFWETAKEELAAIPIDPQLAYVTEDEYSTSYRVNLAHINNRRVYGYITIPKKEGIYPAVLSLPAFGTGANIVNPDPLLPKALGVISMTISIHNAEPDQVDSLAYQPNDITIPEENYLRQAVLCGVRAIDYLHSRADFNGKVGLLGVSQGGGLAILTAGVDERVDFISISGAVYGQHAGAAFDQASGFPYYLRSVENESTALQDAALNASLYYDAIFFARRFKGEVFSHMGYLDDIANPATQLAIFNQFTGSKVLTLSKELPHAHPAQYWSGRLATIRRILPEAKQYAWEWAGSATGYSIYAGQDTSVIAGESLQLSGQVLLDSVLVNLPAQWEILQTNEKINLSNMTESINVPFSTPGKYVLEFSAFDYSELESDQLFYALFDQVEVLAKSVSNTNDAITEFTTIYPNPASEQLFIEAGEAQLNFNRFQIYNQLGQLVQSEVSKQLIETVDVSTLAEGIYSIVLFTSDNQYVTKSFVKVK